MKTRSWVALVSLCLVAVASSAVGAFGADRPELAPDLAQVLDSASADEWIPISVVLRDQLSASELQAFVEVHPRGATRRSYITRRLKEVATRGQEPVLRMLDQADVVDDVRIERKLWIRSVIVAEARPAAIERLLSLPDVRRINLNTAKPAFNGRRDEFDLGEPLESTQTDGIIECGLDRVGAPRIWNEFGVTGAGVVVAIIDTGVCYTHPDVAEQIWVNPGEDLDGDGVVMDPDDMNGIDDDGNGFIDDFIGWDFESETNDPDDIRDHGSHVAGTIVGDGTMGLTAGVAPDAQLMVLRVITNNEPMAVQEASSWAAMEYAADNGADVMSISLGYTHSFDPDRATWRQVAESAIAMGTSIVVSAGNEGSGNEPENITTPGDIPDVITVGAVDCSDVLASFSGHGPTYWDDVSPYNDHPYPPGLQKPEVTAPGEDTMSHNLCSGYQEKSGTSMATPHVSGTAALMLSANPDLEPADVKSILRSSSIDLGAPGPDNAHGDGRIDAYEAVRSILPALRYASHSIDDSDPIYGNGDGHPDYDETVTLVVSLENAGVDTADGVYAVLTPESAGVEVLDDVAFFPTIAAGTIENSLAPHYTFQTSSGCGQTLRFRLDIFRDNGEPSFSRFRLRTGEGINEIIFEDDMETDKGWVAGGTTDPVDGAFVREDPNLHQLGAVVFQPGDDTTASPGTRCWITGNVASGTPPKFGEVDTEAWIDSPPLDFSAYEDLTLEYQRWVFAESDGVRQTTAQFRASGDGGQTFQTFASWADQAPGWVFDTHDLLLSKVQNARIRFHVDESGGVFGQADPVGEGGIDDLVIRGTRFACDQFQEPAAQAPLPVGNTMLVTLLDQHVRLDWTAPGTDASHDAASFYDMYRTADLAVPFTLEDSRTAEFLIDASAPQIAFYVIASRNAGGSSGEEPTP